jgi:membrane protease YdiL (CAAX protease family)
MFKIQAKGNNSVLQFFWQLLILLGMVFTFYALFGFFSLAVTKSFFQIDLFNTMNEVIRNPTDYPKEILALKLNQVFISIGIFVVPAFLFSKSINEDATDFLKIKSNTKVIYFVIMVLIMILSIPLSAWLADLNKHIHLPNSLKFIEDFLKGNDAENKMLTEAFVFSKNLQELFFNIFIVAIIPAICEEIFFRACLQNYLLRTFHKLHVSVFVTAIIFSAIHADFSGFLPRFMFGLVLGYAFFYSQNVWVPVLGHFMNNCLSLVFFYAEKRNPNVEFFKEDYQFPIYLTALAFIALVGLFYLMFKKSLLPQKNDRLG